MAGQNFEEILQHLKKTLKRLSSSLNVRVACECTGKAESHPGRQVSSYTVVWQRYCRKLTFQACRPHPILC